jgi:hypothetical protein
MTRLGPVENRDAETAKRLYTRGSGACPQLARVVCPQAWKGF